MTAFIVLEIFKNLNASAFCNELNHILIENGYLTSYTKKFAVYGELASKLDGDLINDSINYIEFVTNDIVVYKLLNDKLGNHKSIKEKIITKEAIYITCDGFKVVIYLIPNLDIETNRKVYKNQITYILK